MTNTTLHTKGLDIGYSIKGGKQKIIQQGLDIELYAGEVTSLLGLNGAGKSTLIKTLCGFIPPLAGEISFFGKPLSSYTSSEFALKVGVVLTEKTNTGGISVYDLVSLGRHPHTGYFGRLSKKDDEIILSSMDKVGIGYKAKSYVSELSDGERQKVMIAKVLAQGASLIILDEPTAFLDVTSRVETVTLLRKLAAEEGKSILLSTHDLDNALLSSHRLWLLNRDRGVVIGTPEDLINNGSIAKAFDRGNIRFDEKKLRFEVFD